jgi:hypothetical protein
MRLTDIEHALLYLLSFVIGLFFVGLAMYLLHHTHAYFSQYNEPFDPDPLGIEGR